MVVPSVYYSSIFNILGQYNVVPPIIVYDSTFSIL